jgi:hypothetical protein
VGKTQVPLEYGSYEIAKEKDLPVVKNRTTAISGRQTNFYKSSIFNWSAQIRIENELLPIV